MTLPAETTFIAFYPVRDLAATRDFYGRDLGLSLTRDQGSCLIYQAPAGGYLGFCQHETHTTSPDHLILTFVCSDVDAVYHRLRRFGVETEGPPTDRPEFGIYRFFARDPDGYRVEIQRFHQPISPRRVSC